jgi:hypothetical protein
LELERVNIALSKFCFGFVKDGKHLFLHLREDFGWEVAIGCGWSSGGFVGFVRSTGRMGFSGKLCGILLRKWGMHRHGKVQSITDLHGGVNG